MISIFISISIPDIDIILPCYNPSPGWDTAVLERLQMFRSQLPGKKIRVILVNDGSEYTKINDGITRLEAQAKDLLLLSYPTNMGKGFAIRTAVQRSTASVILYTDIDFPYTIDSMLKVLDPILNGEADVALAVRNQTYYTQLPRFRRWMSKVLRSLNRTVLGLHTSDTQGGLKAFSNNLRETFLQIRINRYLFDLEFIYLISRKKDIRVKTIEADLREGIVMSPVRMKILFGEAMNFFKVLMKRK